MPCNGVSQEKLRPIERLSQEAVTCFSQLTFLKIWVVYVIQCQLVCHWCCMWCDLLLHPRSLMSLESVEQVAWIMKVPRTPHWTVYISIVCGFPNVFVPCSLPAYAMHKHRGFLWSVSGCMASIIYVLYLAQQESVQWFTDVWRKNEHWWLNQSYFEEDEIIWIMNRIANMTYATSSRYTLTSPPYISNIISVLLDDPMSHKQEGLQDVNWSPNNFDALPNVIMLRCIVIILW